MKRALMLLFFTTLTSHTVLAVNHELMGLLLAKIYLDVVYEDQVENLKKRYSENAKWERPSRDLLRDKEFVLHFGEDYFIPKSCHETAVWRYLQQEIPIVSDCEKWTFEIGGTVWYLPTIPFQLYALIRSFVSDNDSKEKKDENSNILLAASLLGIGPPIIVSGYILVKYNYRKILYKYYRRALDKNEETWIINSLQMARRLLTTTAENGSNADGFPEGGYLHQIADYYKDLEDKFEEVKGSIDESIFLDLQISNE